ncbi:hypothetical protein C8Q79DRAFT_354597 [Trametes meyenii]|nr:hypothetical protein C8Q79DRAFT_354597 [Trametes meyenii]
MKQFKSARNTVCFLRSLSGFGWDNERQVVVASEELWRKLLYNKDGKRVKKYEAFNKWRAKAFPEYKLVTELMGGNQATGEEAFSSAVGSDAVPGSRHPEGASEDHSEVEHMNVRDSSGTTSSEVATHPELGVDLSTPSTPAVLVPTQQLAPMLPVPPTPTTPRTSSTKHTLSPAPSTPASKRHKSRDSTRSQLKELVGSVDRLVTGLISAGDIENASIAARREAAWERVKNEEQLSPHSLSRARRVFRSKSAVDEYLSFDDHDEEACAFWLQDEIEAIYSH